MKCSSQQHVICGCTAQSVSNMARNILMENFFLILVYLYGEAATEDHRKTLPQVRAGEYEGLPDKVSQCR